MLFFGICLCYILLYLSVATLFFVLFQCQWWSVPAFLIIIQFMLFIYIVKDWLEYKEDLIELKMRCFGYGLRKDKRL